MAWDSYLVDHMVMGVIRCLMVTDLKAMEAMGSTMVSSTMGIITMEESMEITRCGTEFDLLVLCCLSFCVRSNLVSYRHVVSLYY